MHLSVYLPLLVSALFGVLAPSLARRLPPGIATWLLSIGALLAAAGSAAALALLGFTLVGQSPLLAAQGHWSDAELRHADPVMVARTQFAKLGVFQAPASGVEFRERLDQAVVAYFTAYCRTAA